MQDDKVIQQVNEELKKDQASHKKPAEQKEAKANKDFDLSDKIRDDLSALGLTIKDSREGTTWSK